MDRARHLAVCLLAAALLAGCGEEDDDDGEGGRFAPRSVAEVVAGRPGAVGEQVTVIGRAYPVAEIGFVLAGDRAAVFVPALPTPLAKLSDGEPVQVQGVVEEIGPGLARRLDRVASGPEGLGLPPRVEALSPDLDQGAPTISNPSITGEDAREQPEG